MLYLELGEFILMARLRLAKSNVITDRGNHPVPTDPEWCSDTFYRCRRDCLYSEPTVQGRYHFALGSNEESVCLSGVNTGRLCGHEARANRTGPSRTAHVVWRYEALTQSRTLSQVARSFFLVFEIKNEAVFWEVGK